MEREGKLLDNRTLQFVRMLPGPIDRVWEYITDAEKRSKWFCGGSSGLAEGDKFKFVFHNSQLGSPPEPTPRKYAEYGDGFESEAVVVKAVKPHLFVIEWEGVVTFRLEEHDEQVKLTLTHEKLADSKESRVGTLAGWHTHLDILGEVLNDRVPNSFWSAHMAQEKAYDSWVN
ncbi:MAG: SRPBCC family protein [Bacteroidota bacterium]